VSSSKVIVLCYEEALEPGVARSLLRNRWVFLDGRSGKQALKEIVLAHPHAVVVQVPPAGEPATGTIERLSRHWNPMAIVGVASAGANETEVLVRQAGADCFLPCPCTSEELERTLASMVPGVREESGRIEAPCAAEAGVIGTTGREGTYSRRSRRAH
jgi:DNA-binding response OmpR family regulator